MILLFTPMMLFAQGGDEDFSVSSIVAKLSPIVVLAVTFLVNKFVNKISGVWLLLLATGLSGALAWANTQAGGDDLSWILEFSYSMLAVVLNQFYKQVQKI